MKLVLFCALFSLTTATTYTIITQTANSNNANTDEIYLKMTLLGSFGKVQTPYFDDPNRDDFVRGAADKFVFEGLKEVGEIHCIELQAGGDDWWLFDSVLVFSDTQPMPIIFENTTGQGLSSDSSEGLSHMRLCAGGGDITRK
ncbi:hypothetical protein ACHWQZ_G002123 [Mnemiopsis leidyi]